MRAISTLKTISLNKDAEVLEPKIQCLQRVLGPPGPLCLHSSYTTQRPRGEISI